MSNYSLRSDMMTLAGQFPIARLPPAGKVPLKCAWVVDHNNKPLGLYWSDGLIWQAMSGSGPAGPSGTVTVGTTTTAAPGASATVTNTGSPSASVLNFSIPAGAPGGDGAAATVSVGTVTARAAGTGATVTNMGTSSAAILAFGIPTGATGPGATVAIGTVTTGAAGSSAAVVNVGTPTAAVLNFAIPQGAPGTVKQGVRAVTAATGLYTWTYPTPYATGVVPVIELSAEGSASSIVNPQLEGTPTNTSCTVRVTRTAAVTILGISVLGISAAAATPIHITAQAPT